MVRRSRWPPPHENATRRARIGTGSAGATILLVVAVRGIIVWLAGAWAKQIALPEATRLVNMGQYAAAFPFIYRALQVLPGDPSLNRIHREISRTVPIRTTPSGASVYVKPYGAADSDWLFIGQSPLENFLLPPAYFRWRITKPGFRTVEVAAGINGPSIEFNLDPEGSIPPEMLHVPRGTSRFYSFQSVPLDDFWIDKYEVTNRQFKAFVDNGGYSNKDYWREEFVKDGQVLTWEQAVGQFRDATGRVGPATWEVGDYPPGQGEYPVSGVSWYEAAAYARFARRQLPVYHWYTSQPRHLFTSSIVQRNGHRRVVGGVPASVPSEPDMAAM